MTRTCAPLAVDGPCLSICHQRWMHRGQLLYVHTVCRYQISLNRPSPSRRERSEGIAKWPPYAEAMKRRSAGFPVGEGQACQGAEDGHFQVVQVGHA